MAVMSSKDCLSVAYFRAYVREWLKNTGLKQKEAATRLGMTPQAINGLLKRTLSIPMMERFAGKVGIDIADLLAQGREAMEGGPLSGPKEDEHAALQTALDAQKKDAEGLRAKAAALQARVDELETDKRHLNTLVDKLAGSGGEKEEEPGVVAFQPSQTKSFHSADGHAIGLGK